MHITDLKLTLLFDNLSCDARFKRLWGFAALVETPAGRLLFDTGSNGRVLLENMATLGIDPKRIDLLFLSHAHWDHLGGLDSILELNPALALVVPSSLPPLFVADLRILCRNVTVVNEEPLAFAPGVASTGTLGGEMPEQALVMFTEEGTVVITGCAHPGIAVVAEAARRWPGPIRLSPV